jgi:hypothetical protein
MVFFINLSIVKMTHDTQFLAITYWVHVKAVFYLSSDQTVRYFDLIIFTWEKANSQRWFDPKNTVKQSYCCRK